MQPGDRLFVGSGTYREAEIELAVSGTAGKPVIIEGVDRGGGLPLLTGRWNKRKKVKPLNQDGSVIEFQATLSGSWTEKQELCFESPAMAEVYRPTKAVVAFVGIAGIAPSSPSRYPAAFKREGVKSRADLRPLAKHWGALLRH